MSIENCSRYQIHKQINSSLTITTFLIGCNSRTCANRFEAEFDTNGNRISCRYYQEVIEVKEEVIEPSKGLGDTIAKITHATGLDKLFEDKVTHAPCGGCKQRQELLNKIFPYKQQED